MKEKARRQRQEDLEVGSVAVRQAAAGDGIAAPMDVVVVESCGSEPALSSSSDRWGHDGFAGGIGSDTP